MAVSIFRAAVIHDSEQSLAAWQFKRNFFTQIGTSLEKQEAKEEDLGLMEVMLYGTAEVSYLDETHCAVLAVARACDGLQRRSLDLILIIFILY